MAKPNKYFSETLKNWMGANDLKAPKVAELIGCSKTAAYQYLEGRVPEWNLLVDLARTMEIPIESLLGPQSSNKKIDPNKSALKRLKRDERRLLEDALEILRAEGPAAEFGKTLKQTIKSCKQGVLAQKKIVEPSSRKAKAN